MDLPEKLSKLQRWILLEAYKGKLYNEERAEAEGWISSYRPRDLLRIDVVRGYFALPVRSGLGHNTYAVIDTSEVTPEKANAVRSSLTRALRRLGERGLISCNITLTEQGIEVAKEIYERTNQNP